MADVRITIYDAEVERLVREVTTEDRAQIAHQAAGDARNAAPVVTGEYRGGIGVEVDGDTVRIVDNDPEAGFKEYGTSDTPAHAVLTDAARKYGRYSGIQPRG